MYRKNIGRVRTKCAIEYDRLLGGIRNGVMKRKLKNPTPYIVANNCLGGFLYHFLKEPFRSPFINTLFSPEDYIKILEDFDTFMNSEVVYDEERSQEIGVPVGRTENGIEIRYEHYESFEKGIKKWNERITRMPSMCSGGKHRHFDLDNVNFFLSGGLQPGFTREVFKTSIQT